MMLVLSHWDIVFSSLSGTQHTRILDEAQFIETSGTGIAELCLIQLFSHKTSAMKHYTSGFTAFQQVSVFFISSAMLL